MGRLFFMLGMLGYLAGSAFAGIEEDAQRFVRDARRGVRGSENRMLELLIAHPTESILVQAAQWPWDQSGSYVIKYYL